MEGKHGEPSKEARRCEAFISCRHITPDMAAAKALHRQLETHLIPSSVSGTFGKKKMGKVFRDQDELSLMAGLGEGMKASQSWRAHIVCTGFYSSRRNCSTETVTTCWLLKPSSAASQPFLNSAGQFLTAYSQ